MSVILHLRPEIEAGLLAQAQAVGLSLDQFLSRHLEALNPTPASTPIPPVGEGADEWDRQFDAWLDSFPQHPILRDEAVNRENWYPDRW